jgi:hypothetical protein
MRRLRPHFQPADEASRSTWTVANKLDNDSTGSLRWAITQADEALGDQTSDRTSERGPSRSMATGQAFQLLMRNNG